MDCLVGLAVKSDHQLEMHLAFDQSPNLSRLSRLGKSIDK